MFVNSAHSQPSEYRELILEARKLSFSSGDRIWQNFSDSPFGILLVEENRERLFCHQGPAEGFESIGIDPVLGCASGVRKASFPSNMLASFPAVDGIPTIVIGTPEGTAKSSDAWVLTVLHEHFHQLQFSWPGYYVGIEGLGLSGDDGTGMWMLNYPFPYDRHETAEAFKVMAERLIDTLDARGTATFNDSLEQYWLARMSARQTVSENDWKYIELQFWQEGVARWTEGAIAVESDNFKDAANAAHLRIMSELSKIDLAANGRAAVYPIGAAEAMLLESVDPNWRLRYWSEPFSIGPQIEKLIRTEM